MPAIPFHLHPQRAAIMQRLVETAPAVMERSRRDGKVWASLIDAEAALAVFAHLSEHQDLGGELRAAVCNDSHLLVYAVGPLWFVPGKTWLLEQYFARVGRGPIGPALADIDQLALDCGAAGVLMATMLAPNDDALSRIYTQHGYPQQCAQHLKVF